MVHVSTYGLTLASCVHGPSLDSQLRRRTGMWGSTPRANTAVEVHRLANERRAFTSTQRYGYLAAVGTSVRLFQNKTPTFRMGEAPFRFLCAPCREVPRLLALSVPGRVPAIGAFSARSGEGCFMRGALGEEEPPSAMAFE